jgi:hypothetical protein
VTKSRFPTDNSQLPVTTVHNVVTWATAQDLCSQVKPIFIWIKQQNHKKKCVTVISNVIYGNGKTQIFMFWKEFEHVRQQADIK